MKYDLFDTNGYDCEDPDNSKDARSISPTGTHYWHDPQDALEFLKQFYLNKNCEHPRQRCEFLILDETDKEWFEPDYSSN